MAGRHRAGVIISGCFCACAASPFVARAQDKPPMLTVLGAPDGHVKLLANTSQIKTTLTVESTASQPIDVSVRVGPFRDAAGRLHPASASSGAAPPAAPSSPDGMAGGQVAIRVPGRGAVDLRIDARLDAEGEYTGALVLAYGDTRDTIELAVTRASRDLDVELQGVDAIRGTAGVFGSSSAQLRLVVVERAGRALTLDPPMLTKFVQKTVDGARAQAGYTLLVDAQTPKRIELAAHQSQPLVLTLADLGGAGEYTGTVRLVAPGSKPVDQEFTLNLRESRGVAFLAILVGVMLSVGLRWLSQTLRPRLVETRRAQLLGRELDELLADSTRDEEEAAVLRRLRREVVGALLALETGMVTGTMGRIDRLDDRRKLAAEWIVRRRQVAGLQPASLRDRFRLVIDAARDVIVSDASTPEALASVRSQFASLNAAIDEAFRDELTARIDGLRKSIDDLAARTSSQLSVLGPAAIRPLLDAASKAQAANDLRTALAAYDRARRTWAGLLLDDLAAMLGQQAPVGLDAAEWTALSGRLRTELDAATAIVDRDADGAVVRYHSAWARYVHAVSEGLARKLMQKRHAVQADEDLEDDVRALIVRHLDDAERENNAARTAVVSGRTHEALAALARASAGALAADRASPVSRSAVVVTQSVVPEGLPDVPGALVDGRGAAVVISEGSVRATASVIGWIDLLVAVLAVLIASALGLAALWTPDPAWGGWEDRIVAALWGLGLHQFTFAGVEGLTERLRGAAPAGGQS
jgi:hypothetical protein